MPVSRSPFASPTISSAASSAAFQSRYCTPYLMICFWQARQCPLSCLSAFLNLSRASSLFRSPNSLRPFLYVFCAFSFVGPSLISWAGAGVRTHKTIRLARTNRMGGLLLLKKPGVALPLDRSLAPKCQYAVAGLEDHSPSFFSVFSVLLAPESFCHRERRNRQAVRAATIDSREASPAPRSRIGTHCGRCATLNLPHSSPSIFLP